MSTKPHTSSNRRPPVARPKASSQDPRKSASSNKSHSKTKTKKQDENRAPTPMLDDEQLNGFYDHLEKKYNAEGCNTADVVLARMENDAQRGQSYSSTMINDSPTLQLASEQKRNEDLARQLAELQARLDATSKPDASAINEHDENRGEGTAGKEPTNALEKENTELKAKLARALAKNNAGIKGAPDHGLEELRVGDLVSFQWKETEF
ncbi:hypothetical protein B0H14DRAFT_2586705 [Mycena olivaceomarginata]|nr:hypothetical protein B0H14DRAFT_2586705 [Mycena olivaceomarginata]